MSCILPWWVTWRRTKPYTTGFRRGTWAPPYRIIRNYKTQDRPGPAFLFHLLHQKLQKLQLVAGEPPQALIQPLQPHGVGKLHREKLLRRDLQIVANVEEHGHGRQIHAVFDVVDIPGALPQRKAHVPGRHALGLPQL